MIRGALLTNNAPPSTVYGYSVPVGARFAIIMLPEGARFRIGERGLWEGHGSTGARPGWVQVELGQDDSIIYHTHQSAVDFASCFRHYRSQDPESGDAIASAIMAQQGAVLLREFNIADYGFSDGTRWIGNDGSVQTSDRARLTAHDLRAYRGFALGGRFAGFVGGTSPTWELKWKGVSKVSDAEVVAVPGNFSQVANHTAGDSPWWLTSGEGLVNWAPGAHEKSYGLRMPYIQISVTVAGSPTGFNSGSNVIQLWAWR